MRFFRAFALGALVASVSGCSLHPLQDQVTGLYLSDIIHKVTCEAKDALVSLLAQHHLEDKRESYQEANRKISRLKKGLKPLEKEAKKLQERKESLDFRVAKNSTGIDSFQADIKVITLAPDFDPTKPADPATVKRERDLYAARAQILKDLVTYTADLDDHNKRIAEVQKSVRDATKAAKKTNRNLSLFYDHQMAYNFKFRIIETNGLSANANWRLPLVMNGVPGTWTIGAGAFDTRERESERNARLVVTFRDLHGTRCDDAPASVAERRPPRYPITGKIGVYEVISEYFKLLARARRDQEVDNRDPRAPPPVNGDASEEEEDLKTRKVFAKTDAYTDLILFTTTIGGSATPTITLNPTTREQFTGNVGLNVQRKDFHSVNISLAPDIDEVEAQDKIQRVIILNRDPLSLSQN